MMNHARSSSRRRRSKVGSHPTEEDQSSSSARGSDDVVYLSPCPTSPNCIEVQTVSPSNVLLLNFFFHKHLSQFKVPVFSDF